jgi:hypothetical protein
MNISAIDIGSLRRTIMEPTDGVVGLVDEVIALCQQKCLCVEWSDNKCRVRFNGSNEEQVIDVPLRKSVFRAILARVAFLCSEQDRASFSPYGGHGALPAGANSKYSMQAVWVNTPQEQRLELTLVAVAGVNSSAPASVQKDAGQTEAAWSGRGDA